MTPKEQALHIPLSFDDALLAVVKHSPRTPGPAIQIWEGDCRAYLKDSAKLPDNSIHMVLTDPPYFLDGLDNKWRKGVNGATPRATGSVGKLPVGMKFDPKQGKAFQEFMGPVCEELMRVLAPGGFFVCFSQPRLYHRLAIAAEDAGFEIRDLLAWRFTSRAQFKAFSMNHFVEKMDIPDKDKRALIKDMANRKTPQLRPQFEAMLLAQKPRQGTFIENWAAWHTGLIDASKGLDNGVPATVMTVDKPEKYEQDDEHLTVKPQMLLRHLIEVFTTPGQTVLDPFLGSGSTCIAAADLGRDCIGIEINPDYVRIAHRRLKEVGSDASKRVGATRRPP